MESLIITGLRDKSFFSKSKMATSGLPRLKINAWWYKLRTMLDEFFMVENMGVEPKIMSLRRIGVEIVANPSLC